MMRIRAFSIALLALLVSACAGGGLFGFGGGDADIDTTDPVIATDLPEAD